MRDLFQAIVHRMNHNENVVLATITHQEGSTPRDAGTTMALFEDGSIAGTVGGGSAEADVMREGARLFENQKKHRSLLSFSLTDGRSAESLGMVCGGDMDVLLVHLGNKDLPLMQAVLKNLEHETPCFLLFQLNGFSTSIPALSLVDAQNPQPFAGVDFAELSDWAGVQAAPVHVDVEGIRFFANPLLAAPRVFFFGAGHVSRATAEYASMAGFAPVIVDDRKELASAERFPFAHAIHCVPSFETCVAPFALKQTDLVIIASRVPMLDDLILEQVLGTRAGFVGMLGSRKKRDAIFADLRSKGVSQKNIDRVHCPLGISIKAQTPQEIGISIVAELIQARRSAS